MTALDLSHTITPDFTTVTELPGTGATPEQMAMLHTRYSIAGELARDKDVLEVACGTGPGLGYLARSARRVVGGDCNATVLRRAQDHYGDRVTVRQLDAQCLPFPDRSFDVVLLLEAIYYLAEPETFLVEARRVLRPGGVVFLCSANREWTLFNPSPFSHRYFSAGELRRLLHEAGFEASLSAGFPDAAAGLHSRLFRALRKKAVALHLIPRTMRGKALLKKLLHGTLVPLPAELETCAGAQPTVPVRDGETVTGHKVLYAIGHLP